MAENIRLAVRGILTHKMRSFLTMLGVIIGIASIIAIVSTIQGTNRQIMENLIGAGDNCVSVILMQGEDSYYMDMGIPAGVSVPDEELRDAIRSLDGVSDAAFFTSRSYADGITAGKNSLEWGAVRGIDSHYLSTLGYEIYRGRPFVESDYNGNSKVMLLDESAARSLFPAENPLGGTVEISGEPFTVVGLVRKSDSFQPVINNIGDYYTYAQNDSGTIFITEAAWPICYRYDEPVNCEVRAERTEDMSRVGRDAAEQMNTLISGNDSISYQAEDLLQKARDKQALSASTNNLLIWVAAIALLVGGIGVMNIMLVSVTERTSEIGLKKALGARKGRILSQFLTESVVLTSTGGILGVIAGIILAEVISKMTETPVAISIPAILLGVGVSMAIGICFGILPAKKAADLDPIEALRRE